MAKIPRIRRSAPKKTTPKPSAAKSNPGGKTSKGTSPTKPKDDVKLSREAKESKGAKKSDSGGWVPEWVHTGLDIAGTLPVVGNAADIVNAGLYASEGDIKNAGISLAGALPGGQVATGARLAYKAGSNAVEAAGKTTAKKSAKQTGRPKRPKKPQTEELVRDHQNFEKARNKALDEIGSLGHDFKPVKGKFGKAKGAVNGMQSSDGKRGFRLDHDPDKGNHVNWYDWTGGNKGAGGRWGAEKFPGSEKDFAKLLKQFVK